MFSFCYHILMLYLLFLVLNILIASLYCFIDAKCPLNSLRITVINNFLVDPFFFQVSFIFFLFAFWSLSHVRRFSLNIRHLWLAVHGQELSLGSQNGQSVCRDRTGWWMGHTRRWSIRDLVVCLVNCLHQWVFSLKVGCQQSENPAGEGREWGSHHLLCRHWVNCSDFSMVFHTFLCLMCLTLEPLRFVFFSKSLNSSEFGTENVPECHLLYI